MRLKSPDSDAVPPAGAFLLPAELWDRLASARHRLLMLDYDGTLAPFIEDRAHARPSPHAAALLAEVAASPSTRLAVVSGRPLADLVRLLDDPVFTLVGEHGWEVRRPGGGVTKYPLPAGCPELLKRAVEACEALGWGGRLEHKRSGLVLHTRGMDAGEARTLEAEVADLWHGLALGTALRIAPLAGGMELRAAERDKGTAVRELMAASPPGTFTAYLGDDETDEDAFRAVSDGGIGIRVGPEERPSAASLRLASVDETERFLERWAKLTHRPPLPRRNES